MVDVEHVDLKHDNYAASITNVGAMLRTLTHRERPLVVGFRRDEASPAFRGAVLAPWPNRIPGGHYTFKGTAHQLPITEPKRGSAIHGLVWWRTWRVMSRTGDRVDLGYALKPNPGYPFHLDLTVSYALDDVGLHWTVSATNTGRDAAPYGCGPHPYLTPGEGRADDWSLELPAATVRDGSATRPVADTALDFSSARPLASTILDHTFTSLISDGDGRVRARLASSHGAVTCTWNANECPWVQVYTYDYAERPDKRSGVAIEPMTCPPDAFNSGIDLIVLEPGASHRTTWTISAT